MMIRSILVFNWLLILLSYISLLCLSSCAKSDSITNPDDTTEPQKYPPSAQFSAIPTSGVAPLSVSFDAGASTDQDGEIVSYNWDFGDGSSHGEGMITGHTYSQEGNFMASLTVTDNDDKIDTKSIQITVTSPPGPVLFPMYLGSQWAYKVVVYNKPIDDNTGANASGEITATITEYNEENIQAKLSVEGDLVYFPANYIPITIPEAVYLREKANSLERSESANGPWEKTIQLSGSPWDEGGLIFAGSSSWGFTVKQSSMTIPIGTFPGLSVKSQEDNWGEQYPLDDHEYSWKEFFNLDIGLIWSKYYLYYDDSYDTFGPLIRSKEITLVGYAIFLPDGTILQGGTGASVQVMVDCSPGIVFGSGTPPEVNDKYTPIHLRFTMDMDRSAVEQAFSVGLFNRSNLPPLVYNQTGSFVWDGDRHMIWTPDDKYEYGFLQSTFVYVKIKNDAQSTGGYHLSDTVIFVFRVI